MSKEDKDIIPELYGIYQKKLDNIIKSIGDNKISISITPTYDDSKPPESTVVKWIKVEGKDTLPELDTEILLWYYIGHRYHRYIGELIDTNNYEKGYNESYSCMGAHQSPLEEYPKNMRWRVNGYCADFKDVTYWAKI